MRIVASIIIIVLFVSTSFAQRMDANGWSSEQNSFVQAYGFFSASSSDFSSKFLRQAFFGDELSSTQIADQYALLNSKINSFGADYESALRLKLGLLNSGSFLFKISDFAHADASLDKELFGLAFKGNAPYAGDSLFFKPSQFNYYKYQQLGIGYEFELNEDTRLFAMISAINAQSATSAAMYRGAIYTSSFGDTLYTDAYASGFFTNSNRRSNGGGAALSFGINANLEIGNSDWLVNMAFENIGLIQYSNTTQFSVDTAVTYIGFEVNDFSQNIGADIRTQVEDSLLPGFDEVSSKTWNNAGIPGYAQFSMQRQVESGLAVAFGGTYRWQSSFKTYTWLSGGYQFENGLSLMGEAGYGGYTSLQFGASAMLALDQLQIQARIANIERLATSNKNLGLTAFLGIQYQFEL